MRITKVEGLPNKSVETPVSAPSQSVEAPVSAPSSFVYAYEMTAGSSYDILVRQGLRTYVLKNESHK